MCSTTSDSLDTVDLEEYGRVIVLLSLVSYLSTTFILRKKLAISSARDLNEQAKEDEIP